MLEYYASVLPFISTVDELIEVMKPWYDNYCFAEEEYGKVNHVQLCYGSQFPNKLHRFWLRDSKEDGGIKRTGMDYDKLRMLIRHDKNFSHDASIIQDLVTKGFVTGKLVENFPAENINDPDNFLSLLFYFGMVTIDGEYKVSQFVICKRGMMSRPDVRLLGYL